MRLPQSGPGTASGAGVIMRVRNTARPATRVLINQGVMVATAQNTQSQTLTNSGLLQGDAQLLLNTRQLDNQQTGTLYSAANLTLTIPGIVNNGFISGDAALTIQTTTLTGEGLLQGVSALTLAGDTLTQGTAGRWLTAGALDITAASLTNSGRVQGESLDLNISGELNNAVNGEMLSLNALNLTTATLINSGTVQGGSATTLTATTRVQNDGDILAGGRLTLTTSQLTTGNYGLLQALTLLVDAMQTINGGKIVATGDAELRGTSLTNTGTLQGANLQVLNNTLTNSGTMLGTTSLTVKSATVSNAASGKLFSAGNLLLDSNTLTSAGQVVALGDATLTPVMARAEGGFTVFGRNGVMPGYTSSKVGMREGQAR